MVKQPLLHRFIVRHDQADDESANHLLNMLSIVMTLEPARGTWA